MCGIFGIFKKNTPVIDDEILNKMGSLIQHRGPDERGFLNFGRCAIGNQRLSIIDIAGGAQPITSQCERYTVVQNGEIYNYKEIRAELIKNNIEFETKSDTEVILQAFIHYGEKFVSHLNGMFSIAIYDKHEEKLYLYRDRAGVKPLYIYEDENQVAFASEIKSLLALGFKRKVNHQALFDFLSFNYVPLPQTIFENIIHLMPGEALFIDPQNSNKHYWWELKDIKVDPSISEEDAIENIQSLLDDATKIRLRADVEIGAFLSGGVDSSAVVESASRLNSSRLKTYCIGFNDKRFDESSFAQLASDKFQTDHRLEIAEYEIFKMWPKSIYYCDQPQGDISFIPTYMVSSLAAKDLKVVLTGDGADELFAGYEKYTDFFESHSAYGKKYFESISLLSDKEKINLISSSFKEKLSTLDSYDCVKNIQTDFEDHDDINKALALDFLQLLPGNNLVKPDRMGMSVSLEARNPFMDFRLVEFAFSLPGQMKIKNNEKKYILKKAMRSRIGDDLAYRKKQMFTVPVGEWFKDSLSDFVKSILTSKQFLERNLFNENHVNKIIDEHLNGIKNHTRLIRALIAIEIWFRLFIDRDEISEHQVI